jgi:hypothetical protein
MKRITLVAGLLLAYALNCDVLLGEFLNFNFDSPDLSRIQPGAPSPSGPTEDLLRGWTVQYEDGSDPSRTWLSGKGAHFPLSLKTATPIPGTGVDFGPYRVFIAAPETSSIRFTQRGLVPEDATSLQYYRWTDIPFQVMINGEMVNYSENIFTLIGTVDVSKFAGTEATFDFVFPRGSYNEFDISGFLSVPEPSTWALLGLGGAALAWQCRPRRHS